MRYAEYLAYEAQLSLEDAGQTLCLQERMPFCGEHHQGGGHVPSDKLRMYELGLLGRDY